MYTISSLICAVVDIKVFFKSGRSVHIMYIIFRWICKILDIQFPYKSKQSVHAMYTISLWIYAILDIRFFCKSKKSLHIMYTISVELTNSRFLIFRQIQTIRASNVHNFPLEFTQIWIFNIFTNPNNSYI